jgi:hypothetical protein
MIEALVIDAPALDRLSSALFDDFWFGSYLLPASQGLKRVEINQVIYFLSEKADENSKVLVVNVGPSGVFNHGVSPRHVFERIMHVARATFEQRISINHKWAPFEQDALLSIYAEASGIRGATGQRTHFDRHPKNTRHVYAFATTEESKNFSKIKIDWALFDRALSTYEDAVLAPPDQAKPGDTGYGIQLETFLGAHLIGTLSLEEWYSKRLTPNQKKFVDAPIDRPIRLRGAAGTGKTLSMVIKCIRELYRLEDQGRPARIAFITHSEALATEVVEGMLSALDPSRRWDRTKSATLWRGSLYQLARNLLDYQKKGLRPLSLDGVEGRELQRLLVQDAISKSQKNTIFAKDILPRCEPSFQSLVLDRDGNTRFLDLLLNEFASVLDADGIRRGTDQASRYVSSYRDEWLMPLPTASEREAVLHIHNVYCDELDKSQYLSMDQMIGDLSRYLINSAEWRQLRSRAHDRKGFDLIFVDEFHYFNKIEAAIFHNLFSKDEREQPLLLPLFMAYDLKQSPTDAAINASSLFRATGAGETTLMELTEVFRSNPPIVAFLADLDGAFPAYQLADDWKKYPKQAHEPESQLIDVPNLKVFSKETELLDSVFAAAEREANLIGGRQVAVLCPNDALFAKYLNVGRINDKFVPISSRENIGELRYVRRKFIFSMPQHVSGLQFQSVYLINVDRDDLPSDATEGERRRVITRYYVGASRAISNLQIASSLERGGPSQILNTPLTRGSLKLV